MSSSLKTAHRFSQMLLCIQVGHLVVYGPNIVFGWCWHLQHLRYI